MVSTVWSSRPTFAILEQFETSFLQENTAAVKPVNRSLPVPESGLYGGPTLDKTASFAIKALQVS